MTLSASVAAAVLGLLAAAVVASTVSSNGHPYAYWRNRDQVSLDVWRERFHVPKPIWPPLAEHQAKSVDERQDTFFQCLKSEFVEFQQQNKLYRSPELAAVRQAVRAELDARSMRVWLVVFWGRMRYVTILWPYIERYLRKNGGIIDRVSLLQSNRSDSEGVDGNWEYLQAIAKQHPDVVIGDRMCQNLFGCVYRDQLRDPAFVYVKLDDDIVFIKDGSFEHLVYEALTNDDYSFYVGNIVNHPHCSAVHRAIGAYPQRTFHWYNLSAPEPPFINTSHVPIWYFGKTMYDTMGSQAHQSFVHNMAAGRLDVYTFDVWNMNACRCGKIQEALEYCDEQGYYRWNINVIAWTLKPVKYLYDLPSFDEPHISMKWARRVKPQARAGVVGESLFVHEQYLLQRDAAPSFGLEDAALLPWYKEVARQYTALPFGAWAGNASLVQLFEQLQESIGEKRYSGVQSMNCVDAEMPFEREQCFTMFPDNWRWQ